VPRHKRSDYLHWAKTARRSRYNLATSGVAAFPLRELPIDLASLEINGENSYGYRPLQCAIAARYGVDPDCVVEAGGASAANFLAMATLIEPGDEVLIEHPAYGPLLDAAQYLQAEVKRFARREETRFAVDPEEIRRSITHRTRLIVITNLHNPSSAFTPDSILRGIGALAREAGAHVLVDEAYVDLVYENTPRPAVHLGPEFLVTSSLTKAYGLSGLRCGWILAAPELAWRMRHLSNVFAPTGSYPAELLSAAAFEHLDAIRERARGIVTADRALLKEFLERHRRALSAAPSEWGSISFLRLREGDADSFLERLRVEHDTVAVPGRFFEMPGHFRAGMGVDHQAFAEGLQRISRALG
jgi:aspartate/methionine/tyrosine aminotransferase